MELGWNNSSGSVLLVWGRLEPFPMPWIAAAAKQKIGVGGRWGLSGRWRLWGRGDGKKGDGDLRLQVAEATWGEEEGKGEGRIGAT